MGLSQLLYPVLQEDPIPSRLHSPLSLPLLYPSTFLPFSPISSPAYPPTHPLWHLWPCSLLTQQQDHMMVVKIAPFIRV